MKRRVRLTESDLHRIVKESVKRVLRENSRDIDDDNYFGGGLPDRYFNNDAPDDDSISQKQLDKLGDFTEWLYDIANNTNCSPKLLYKAADCIIEFISQHTRS